MFCYICVLESFLLRGPVDAGRRGGGRLRHERLLVDAAEPGNSPWLCKILPGFSTGMD